MPKLSDFITQFEAAEIIITLCIILLIVGVHERFNIKKLLRLGRDKKTYFKSIE